MRQRESAHGESARGAVQSAPRVGSRIGSHRRGEGLERREEGKEGKEEEGKEEEEEEETDLLADDGDGVHLHAPDCSHLLGQVDVALL